VKVFFDTSFLIDLLARGKKATEMAESYSKSSALYTSRINYYELLKGAYAGSQTQKDMDAINILISNLTILEFDSFAADASAKIFAELRQKGKPIGEPDYMIAGCALSNGVNTILTGNKKHFEHIKGLKVIVC